MCVHARGNRLSCNLPHLDVLAQVGGALLGALHSLAPLVGGLLSGRPHLVAGDIKGLAGARLGLVGGAHGVVARGVGCALRWWCTST